MAKLEHTYWITKQNVLSRMGKKEDECVVSSDAELDAKLELFRSIQDSCLELQRILERYQDRLSCLAQEENALGRFLKEAGAADSVGANQVLTTAGRVMSYSGKQRLGLRVPLHRLLQEVNTFRLRAVADTSLDLKAMEKHRTEYRAALNWMKDVSQELDPDRQLDRFRMVQGQVRRSKVRFDQLKLVCLQKIDLLAAARCNMFSHALVLYHASLLEFAEKAAHAFEVVSKSLMDTKSFDFSVIKELAEAFPKEPDEAEEAQEKKDDVLLFFDPEYCDEERINAKSDKPKNKTESQLLELEAKDELALLDLDLNKQSKEGDDESWTKQWEEVFGGSFSERPMPDSVSKQAEEKPIFECLSSNLFDQFLLAASPANNLKIGNVTSSKPSRVTSKNDEKMAWFDLFADLDPLADPDAIGAKKNTAGRQC